MNARTPRQAGYSPTASRSSSGKGLGMVGARSASADDYGDEEGEEGEWDEEEASDEEEDELDGDDDDEEEDVSVPNFGIDKRILVFVCGIHLSSVSWVLVAQLHI